MLIGSIALFLAAILFLGFFLPSLAMAQLTTSPTTSPLSLTPQEQLQQTRLQNITTAIAQSLAQGQKQIGGVVFTPRWSDPVWIEPRSSSVLFAYCLPGEFAYGLPGDIANPVQGILGGPELVLLDSYAAPVTPDLMMWFLIVQNQDVQNRLPAAAGVICASDVNDAQSRILSPVEQQEVNNIIQQFTTLQNTPGTTNINQVIDKINNNVTNQNATGAGGGTPTPPGPECPPGYTFNPETDQCEQTVTGPASCATGFTFNPDTDLCERVPTCGPGFTYNPETDQCEQINTQAVECPAGTTFNPATDQCERAVTQAPTTPSQPGGADTTRPTLTVPNDMVLQTVGPTALLVYSVTSQDDKDGTATLDEDNHLIQGDNIGGDITIFCRPQSQYFLPIGNRTVECRALDAVNNTADASFTVSVIAGPPDTTPPILSVPEGIVRTADSNLGVNVQFSVTAQDNVDGTATLGEQAGTLLQDDVGGYIDLRCSRASGDMFPVGNHTVKCEGRDAAGNYGRASFTVTVNRVDDFKPLIEEQPLIEEEGAAPPAEEEQPPEETTDEEGAGVGGGGDGDGTDDGGEPPATTTDGEGAGDEGATSPAANDEGGG